MCGVLIKVWIEIEFSNRTSMTSGTLLNMFLMLLVCFVNVLMWNDWYEGVHWCCFSGSWNVNWFFWFDWWWCDTHW